MDLHDYQDVAENYDKYIDSLVGFSGFDNETCIEFHLELARKYGQKGIIDVGCGTGLILMPLAQEGYKVTGVDLSEAMTMQTKKKVEKMSWYPSRVHLIKASMCDFNVSKKASLIILPRSAFLHLTNTDDQMKALETINSNLEMGGILSLNTFYPSYDVVSSRGVDKGDQIVHRTDFINNDGNVVQIFNDIKFYPEQQLMKGEWIFEEKDSLDNLISKVVRPITMRWTFESEMRLLFRMKGFEIIKMYGGYDKSEVAYPGQIIWVVKKVAEK